MEKRLIVINGTMGVGKTSVSEQLKILMPKAVMLDGDWCWSADPFTVNSETKKMVINNIAYLLTAFLNCSEYENIIFCWVMNEIDTFAAIKEKIAANEYVLYQFSLICTPEALYGHIAEDIKNGKREKNAYQYSLKRLDDYELQNTIKIDVTDLDSKEAARIIYEKVVENSR